MSIYITTQLALLHHSPSTNSFVLEATERGHPCITHSTTRYMATSKYSLTIVSSQVPHTQDHNSYHLMINAKLHITCNSPNLHVHASIRVSARRLCRHMSQDIIIVNKVKSRDRRSPTHHHWSDHTTASDYSSTCQQVSPHSDRFTIILLSITPQWHIHHYFCRVSPSEIAP